MIKKEWLAKACLFSCCSGIVGTQNVGAAFNLREVNLVDWFYFLRECITRYLFPDYYTSNLAEEVRKIFKECFGNKFGNKNEYARHRSRDYLDDFCDEIQEIGLPLGEQRFSLEIKRFYFLTMEPPRIEVSFKHSGGKLIKKFCVKSKEELEEVKSFFEFIAEKSRQNIEKIDELEKKCNFYVNVDGNSCENFVITWPDNFKPKFTFENKEIENEGELFISKLEYNISTGNFFAYSPGYKEGKSPIKLEEKNVEALFESIKEQKEDFDSNLINKVKNQISEKYKNIEWKYDGESREHKGTFEIAGMNFTISLQSRRHYGEWRNGKRDEKYQCEIKILDRVFLYCDAFNEEEEKKFTNLMSNLKFCTPEIKKLRGTGDFEESKFPFGDFDLVPKKPFYIKYSDGDVIRFDHIKFYFSQKVVLYGSGIVHHFKLNEESGRKAFSDFVKLWVDKKVMGKTVSLDEFDPDPLPDPLEKYTRSFGELSPCPQEDCNIKF